VATAFAPHIFTVDQKQEGAYNNKINFTKDWKIVPEMNTLSRAYITKSILIIL
jgi:hypothetical protein